MSAWSIVALWSVVSVPVSLALGVLLASGERDFRSNPTPAPAPQSPVARPVA